MSIIDASIAYLRNFATQSESLYHVNPWIFSILFFGSALPLYYGYYRIGRSVIRIEKRKIKRKKIDKKELKIGLIISTAAWLLPYAYVFIFGRLPLDILIVFIIFVLIMGGFFAKSLNIKLSKVKKEIID